MQIFVKLVERLNMSCIQGLVGADDEETYN